MAVPRVRQGQNTQVANAATRSRAVWTGLALFGAGVATLMIVGCAKGIKQNEGVNVMGNGSGQAQIIAEAPKQQAPSDTLKTTPKIVAPDVRTLEHYYPFHGKLTDSSFIKRDGEFNLWKGTWMTKSEDTERPFGLPQKVIDSYSPQDKAELMRRWETAKNEIRVAFLSDKGANPSNALKVHAPAEVEKLLVRWESEKQAEKRDEELLRSSPKRY